MKASRVAATLLILFTTTTALADDPKSQDVTIQPWTGARVNITPDTKTAALSYNQWLGDWAQFYVQLTAPLDSDTRIAAFTKSNQLTTGFSAQMQFGYDSRATDLKMLEAIIDEWTQYAKAAKALPSGDNEEQLVADIQSIGEPAPALCVPAASCWQITGDAVLPSEATASAQARQKLGTRLGWACQTYGVSQPKCTWRGVYDAIPAEVAFCKRKSANAPPANCDAAIKYADAAKLVIAGTIAAYGIVVSVHKNPHAAERILALYKRVAGKDADPDDTKTAVQKVFDNLDTIKTQFDTYATLAPLALRDLLVTGDYGSRPGIGVALVADASVSYDNLTVYVGDANNASKQNVDKYDIQAGANGTLFFPDGWSLNARVGWELSRDPKAKTMERCLGVSSTDPNVTARSCDSSALFINSTTLPSPKSQAYVRIALDKQFFGAKDTENKVIPGFEVRTALEGLGQETVFSGRIGLYVTPAIGSSALRAGVALQVDYDFDGNIDTINNRPWDVIPFIYVGATTTALMGK